MKNVMCFLLALMLCMTPNTSCNDNENSNFFDVLANVVYIICFGNPQKCHKIYTQRHSAQSNNTHTNNNNLRTDSWMQNYVYNQYAQIKQQFPGFDVMKNTNFVIESLRRDYRAPHQGNGESVYTKDAIDFAIGSNLLNYMQQYTQNVCQNESGLPSKQCKIAAARIFSRTHNLLMEKKVVDPSELVNVFSTEMNQEIAQLLDQQPKQPSHHSHNNYSNTHYNNPPYNPEYIREQEQLDRDTQRAIDESRKEFERKQQQTQQQQQSQSSPYNPEWTAQKNVNKGKEESDDSADESSSFQVVRKVLSCGHSICPDCWKDQIAAKKGQEICPQGNIHVSQCGKNVPGSTFKKDNAPECVGCTGTFI